MEPDLILPFAIAGIIWALFLFFLFVQVIRIFK